MESVGNIALKLDSEFVGSRMRVFNKMLLFFLEMEMEMDL